MKNMKPAEKIFSLLMALVLLISAWPLAAYAEAGMEAVSAQAGAEEASVTESSEEGKPGETAEPASTEKSGKEQPEMTEDGHIDGERLKQWLENYLKADHWDEPQCSISVGFWYSGSDETWLYNPDEWMYGVNWSKLPISMVYAEKLANGELSNDSVITGLQLEYALQTVLENSSGSSFYSMVTYLGGNTVSNCAELVPQYAGLPDSYYTDEFYQQSYYTARIMMEVTKTLYLGGDERFPKVLEYMKKSQPWDMFNRDNWIREDLHTSQTHAAVWGDGAGDYLHCTGVIYTDSPIVVTIMMKNISDLDIMGGIAHHLAELGQRMSYRQEQIREAEEAASTHALAEAESKAVPDASHETVPDPEAQTSEPPAGSAAATADKTEAAETASPAPEPVQEAYSRTPRILLLAVSALVLVLLIVITVLQRNRQKPLRKKAHSKRKE